MSVRVSMIVEPTPVEEPQPGKLTRAELLAELDSQELLDHPVVNEPIELK